MVKGSYDNTHRSPFIERIVSTCSKDHKYLQALLVYLPTLLVGLQAVYLESSEIGLSVQCVIKNANEFRLICHRKLKNKAGQTTDQSP